MASGGNSAMIGILWVTLSMALFAVLAAGSRTATDLGYHPLQVVFLRNFSAVLLMLPMLYWRGGELYRSTSLHLYSLRVAISFVSMCAWFYALSLIPLGEVTAIGFLTPLFGTLCAIVFLGEVVRIRRWTAIAVGLIGAMIILRPGASAFGFGQACALVSALAGGVMGILLKRLAAADHPDKIVFLTALMLTPISLVPALFVWKWPGLDIVPALLVIAITAVTGHAALMRGYRSAEASLIMSLEFVRLPFAVTIGYFMFGELIDKWTWIGAGIIFASAYYITRREAKLRREANR
jgi:drug/metabolite transporter (DMT)-like permease